MKNNTYSRWSSTKIMHRMLKVFPQFVSKIPTKIFSKFVCRKIPTNFKLHKMWKLFARGREIKNSMFRNHFRRSVTLQTELYDWWELDDHRFQSKLVIFLLFSAPAHRWQKLWGQHPTKYSKYFWIFKTSSIDVSWANTIIGRYQKSTRCYTLQLELAIVKA